MQLWLLYTFLTTLNLKTQLQNFLECIFTTIWNWHFSHILYEILQVQIVYENNWYITVRFTIQYCTISIIIRVNTISLYWFAKMEIFGVKNTYHIIVIQNTWFFNANFRVFCSPKVVIHCVCFLQRKYTVLTCTHTFDIIKIVTNYNTYKFIYITLL